LVNFARFAGYEYNGIKDSNTIMVKTKDEIEEYKLLNTLEFDSTRKRMSTLVQNSQGQIILYCKGADTIILERLNKSKF
jgi:magnesium-transporting ATPase (P-type)